MKKLMTLALAAAMMLGATTGANAIDFKAKGQWIMSFDYGMHGDFAKSKANRNSGYKNSTTGNEDEFEARQRVRLQLDAVASEALSGTVFFEIGDQVWGNDETGGALGADKSVVELKRAYIDWMVPNTELKVRMGLQGMSIPSFTMKKSQVFEDDVAGITVSYQFTDNVAATVFWARPYNDNYTKTGHRTHEWGSDSSNFMDNVDAFGLLIPLTFDGFKVTPWGMIAAIGPNAFAGYNEDEGVRVASPVNTLLSTDDDNTEDMKSICIVEGMKRVEKFLKEEVCPQCGGSRLSAAARGGCGSAVYAARSQSAATPGSFRA